jgi:hypothetical protein
VRATGFVFWFRFIKSRVDSMKYLLMDIFTSLPRLYLNYKIRKMTVIAKETLITLKRERKFAIDHGATSLSEIYNIGMYITIASDDLTILKYQLLLEPVESIKNVYCRQLILIIYELLNDFPNLFGKRLREITRQLPRGSEHLTEFQYIGRSLGEMRKRHSSEFRAIRNIVVAHRDLDGEKPYNVLSELDSQIISSLASELIEWTSKVLRRLELMTKDYSRSSLQIKEVAEKIKQPN